MSKLTIKAGDKLTVTACYFQVPDWMDDQPCVLLSPILMYSESNGAYSVIEEFLIDLTVEGECESEDEESVNESLQWVGKSLSSLRRNVAKSLKTGESLYKSVCSEVVTMEIEITDDGDEELGWKEISKREIN